MSWFEKWSVWSTATVTALTGFGFFWVRYLLSSSDPWSVINHPVEPWLLKVHIISAPLLVFAVGLISLRHIWRHFRARIPWGRKSGILTALVTAPMVLTGYLIQAVTHAGWLKAMAISHIALGAAFSVGLVLHLLFIRQRLRASEHPDPQPANRRANAPGREVAVAPGAPGAPPYGSRLS